MRLPPRRIAPQREHVLDAARGKLVEDVSKLPLRVPDRGEMGHGLHADLALDPRDEVHGEVSGAPARSIRDRDEAWSMGRELLRGRVEALDGLGRLRREELERKDGA